MKIYNYPKRETWPALCQRPEIELEFLESSVKNILNRIKVSGDRALIELTAQFDKVSISELRVTQQEIAEAEGRLPSSLKNAIQAAAANIEKFHATQKKDSINVETMPGVLCWRKGVAIEKVGIYIPGGSAPLFSTVLMLGIPAKLAGCKEVVLCSPPGKDGKINDAILFAARLVGATKIFKAGGAQAIAALAYGTESIPAVNKIFGPGNQYVTKAKQLVNLQGTAIDMPAGPSEVLVVADSTADPVFVASDLLAQAEHGPDSQVVLVTLDTTMISKIEREITAQLAKLPRKEVANEALNQSLAILLSSEKEIVDFVNEYAPEHLILNTVDCDALSETIYNAGSIFLGPYSPESAGDYASGTNHTLPTNGFAKAYGGVSLESFMKYITFQKLTKKGIQTLGPIVETMASAEQLEGHKESISVRLRALL
jgi:histidinol dehydrogenase